MNGRKEEGEEMRERNLSLINLSIWHVCLDLSPAPSHLGRGLSVDGLGKYPKQRILISH